MDNNTHPTSIKFGREPRDIIDLEAIIITWARQMFDITKTKIESRIARKHLDYNINWRHLLVETCAPVYTIDGVAIVDDQRIDAKHNVCLFRTTFTNTTNREQEYSFKTERTTRSSATVIVEKGVSRGVEMALKLKTPCEVVEANAGFSTEISVYNIGENTTEEELVWGVDSNVRVPERCETIAELIVAEEQQKRRFTVETRMSGRIIVTVTNLHDNNSLVTVLEGQIADIIRGINYAPMGFTVTDSTVSYLTKGIASFKYGVEQRVKILEHAL